MLPVNEGVLHLVLIDVMKFLLFLVSIPDTGCCICFIISSICRKKKEQNYKLTNQLFIYSTSLILIQITWGFQKRVRNVGYYLKYTWHIYIHEHI